jgi:hypothetical protein
MNSSVACHLVDSVDVLLLRAQYMAAFERYREHVEKLAEHSGGAEPPPVHLLEAERLTLQDFARTRAALLEALALVVPQIDAGILSDSRDEAIRRSIAKRGQDVRVSARKQRLRNRLARRARLVTVASGRTDREQHTGGGDESRTVNDHAVEGTSSRV